MKYVASALLFFLFAQSAFSQEEDAELARLRVKWKAQIEAEMAEKGIGESNPDEWRFEGDSLAEIYERDTFLLNRMMSLRTDHDYSTQGMVEASVECMEGYDALLNKYYKMLLAKLEGPDKEILKKSQRNWIAFRDSEEELNGMLTKEEYSGGGTIQRLHYCGRNLEMVKARVNELFIYLIR